MIKGYREMTSEELKAINSLKDSEKEVLNLLENIGKAFDVDGRWLAIGRTHIEQGYMAAVRSIAKPE